MPDISSNFTRRALLATFVGGATIATALAQPRVRRSLGSGAGFRAAFRAPAVALARSDHLAWSTEIGTVLEVYRGPSLRVAGVELFADYGRHRADLIRGRAFLVRFDVLNGGRLAGDGIYTVAHPRQDVLDLFLISDPNLPSIAQAIFN